MCPGELEPFRNPDIPKLFTFRNLAGNLTGFILGVCVSEQMAGDLGLGQGIVKPKNLC